MDWSRALFGGWAVVGRTALVGVLAYCSLVILLRVSGKRTLSKFNAFDFIVTVALGSVLASVLTSSSVTLAQGITALAVLIAAQFGVTWLSVRVPAVRHLVQGEPTLLFFRGEFLDGAMRRERVTRDAIMSAARSQGCSSLATTEAAVLETDGTVTIVPQPAAGQPSSLDDVEHYPRASPPLTVRAGSH